MFNIFRNRKPLFELQPLNNGKFAIFKDGRIERTYSRRRDAVRGADRMGVTLANG
jgi:hypothetical protein